MPLERECLASDHEPTTSCYKRYSRCGHAANHAPGVQVQRSVDVLRKLQKSAGQRSQRGRIRKREGLRCTFCLCEGDTDNFYLAEARPSSLAILPTNSTPLGFPKSGKVARAGVEAAQTSCNGRELASGMLGLVPVCTASTSWGSRAQSQLYRAPSTEERYI